MRFGVIVGKMGLRERPGFTMVEILVAMGLATVILAGMVTLFATSNQAYVDQDQVVAAEQNLRASMEIMAYEFRMAGFIPLDNLPGGPTAINADVSGQTWTDGTFERLEEAGSGVITFVSDINADDLAETVRYTLSGNQLLRQSWTWDGAAWVAQAGGVPVVLAENITGLQFTYFFADGSSGIPSNADGNTNNDREDVRSMVMSVSGQTAAMLSGGSRILHSERTLQSRVDMRNMGLDVSTK
ncbi:MAG: prepilin-type N-terminal cleavage/methylation domain-containing protein [Pseudomonadota bacterium]